MMANDKASRGLGIELVGQGKGRAVTRSHQLGPVS
jgi:hypothetical protein